MSAQQIMGASADVAELVGRLDALLDTQSLDHREFAGALLAAVEAMGLPDCARACGMSCVNLHRQLSGRRGLSFGTVMRVTGVLGLRLRIGVI